MIILGKHYVRTRLLFKYSYHSFYLLFAISVVKGLEPRFHEEARLDLSVELFDTALKNDKLILIRLKL